MRLALVRFALPWGRYTLTSGSATGSGTLEEVPVRLLLLPLLLAGCALPSVGPEVSLPAAVAPPGPGAAMPALELDAPGRGADQLAAWSQGLAATTGVPARALQAYGWAAAVTGGEDPGCRIGWTTLAGIGSVESRHGSYRGASLDADNRAVPPIRGLPLDGRPGLAEVADTDGGRLDGDPQLDRAVGPMQFIPGTWARWGADGDGDGVRDPDDLDDAALAAARYLCASGGDLATAQGWRRAVLTYNRSSAYVDDVLQRAAGYADGPV